MFKSTFRYPRTSYCNNTKINIHDIFCKIPESDKNTILSERIAVIEFLVRAIHDNRKAIMSDLYPIVEKFKQCYRSSDFSTMVDKNGKQLFTLDEIEYFDRSHIRC